MWQQRIRHTDLHNKVMAAEEAVQCIQPNMTIGMSGFTRAGDSKALPIALAAKRPHRQPIPLTEVDQRIGNTAIAVDPERIVAIVLTDTPDSPSAVTQGLVESDFQDLTMYSEVLQDSAFHLLESGQLRFASASSITVTAPMMEHFFSNLDTYRDRLVLRPQEISNHPELVRRLGIIAINTALEFDIYGNVNSTHVSGTKMMNGIGGSGDFARNAHLSIFVTKSLAKGNAISRVVPMVSHVDHCEHDVDILVTEQGLADLRGLAPVERAELIIEYCVHPDFQEELRSYFERACARGGQTPHLLEEALSWHQRLNETGSMQQQETVTEA